MSLTTPQSRQALFWTPQPPPHIPLPDQITRSFIATPSGRLELLSAGPTSPGSNPVLLIHGGFGSAIEYTQLLLHLASSGRRAYALSLRGHGHSWSPSFIRLVFLTSAGDLVQDVAAGVHHVQAECGTSPVLVAHSSGGGLAQLLVNQGLEVAGLVLLASTPCYGAWRVYWNWWTRLDKWFMPRMYLWDLGHPRSPLSSAELVRAAFFSSRCSEEVVRMCQSWMPAYESLIWPMQVMFRFVDVKRGLRATRGRVLVVAAEKDRLMRVEEERNMAAEYRRAAKEDKNAAVGFEVIKGSGHNIHNDVSWEDAARVLSSWLDELD